ncbi:MAG: hypothetical protein LBG83_03555 [Oscillospiraceae bacterium]|jgi:hypothetical protein|nr:hypothetical protein [Oscillospiraceae bacterium]
MTRRARKVFAHFMPAHGDGGSSAHHKSLIGPHDLHDPDVMEYQILTAKAAHLDGFILNPTHFRGDDDYDLNVCTLHIIDKICALNKKRPGFDFNFIFSYDDNGIAKGDKTVIDGNYPWIRDNILFHPERSKACFRDDLTGKLVMMVWSGWSGEGRAAHWEAVGRHLGHDKVMLLVHDGIGRDPADGYFSWFFGVPNRSPFKTDEERARLWGGEEYDAFLAQTKEYPGKVFVGSVYPGFDDRLAPWNEGWCYIARDVPEGETFALTWQKIMDYNAANDGSEFQIPWVQVATWNDWPEGTAVEPADFSGYGFRAVESCRRYNALFKQLALSADDGMGIDIPYKILLLRRADKHDIADQVLDCFLDRRYADARNIL